MAETLGSLIDKLSICNIRLWHLEDKCADLEASDNYVAENKRKINRVNLQRNSLIKEIDEMVVDIVEGKAPEVFNHFKSYGCK